MSADPYRKVRRPCTSPYGCGRRVQTLAYVARPLCRACRRRLRNLARGRALTIARSERRTRAALRRLAREEAARV